MNLFRNLSNYNYTINSTFKVIHFINNYIIYKNLGLSRELSLSSRFDIPMNDRTRYYWMKNGLLQRNSFDDLPSIIYKHKSEKGFDQNSIGLEKINKYPLLLDGQSKKWFFYDKKHRNNDLPAEILYDNDNNNIMTLGWYQYNKLHRDNDKPAFFYDHDIENLIMFFWYTNGKLDRKFKPAIHEYENHELIKAKYYQNGIYIKDEKTYNIELSDLKKFLRYE